LVELVQEKTREDELTRGMARLGIGQLVDADAMEWGKRPDLDSDDDSEEEDDDKAPSNPLKILASRELPYRKSKTEPSDEGPGPPSSSTDPYAAAQTTKVDEIHQTSRFVPFSCASDGDSPQDRAALGDRPAKRDPVTAPAHRTDPIPLPPVYNCRTQLMPLQQSLDLQRLQAERLKEVQAAHAAEKLLAARRVGSLTAEIVEIKDADDYRDKHIEFESEEEGESDNEGGINVASYEDCPEEI